jgi:hypothetical protein
MPFTKASLERAVEFLDQIIHRFGLPNSIIIDLGTQFTGSAAIYLIDCVVPSPRDSWDTCAINMARFPRFLLFSGYCASKCARRFLCGRAHTGMLRLTDGPL